MEASPGATNFFGEGSPYLTHPRLTAERTKAEVDAIEAVVGSVAGSRVLDLGCGFGRHAIELASRRADVYAIDPSSAMITEARRRAADAGQFVDFDVVAAQDLTEVARYDLTISLFTSLGQLRTDDHEAAADDGVHRAILEAAKRALRPGGRLVVEVPERERAVEALVADELLGPEGEQTHVTRRFDADASVIFERFELADERAFDLAYRVFGRDELVGLLIEAGFDIVAVRDQALVPPPTTFVTVFARRPA